MFFGKIKNTIFLAAFAAIKEMGLSMPADVALIGFKPLSHPASARP